MIDITLDRHPELYRDYKVALNFLREIKNEDYEYPEEVTPFHVYTEIKDPKELLVVKSYLATQNLEKTKLILWSDYNIEDNELIQPYKDLIDMRTYIPALEAVNTPLEGAIRYLYPTYNRGHWVKSGVLRFLMIYKYGGIWADMDMILLRDFKPILNQDFAYQWGSSIDFCRERPHEPDCHGPCAAMLGGVKESDYTRICLEEMLDTDISASAPRTCVDERLTARARNTMISCGLEPFTVFPSAFFNTEWMINIGYPGTAAPIEECWFDKPLENDDHLFLEAFAWHWHNTANQSKTPVPGSKFAQLEDLTNARLKERGIL